MDEDEMFDAETVALEEDIERLQGHEAVQETEAFINGLIEHPELGPGQIMVLLQNAVAHLVSTYRDYFDDLETEDQVAQMVAYRQGVLVRSVFEHERQAKNQAMN